MNQTALHRAGTFLGLLLVLASLAWGSCSTQYSDFVIKQAKSFAKKIATSDPDDILWGPQFVVERSQALIDKTLYCGVVVRGYRAGYYNDDGRIAQIGVDFACFGFAKDSKWYPGSCLMLHSNFDLSEISMEFKKKRFILHFREDYWTGGKSIDYLTFIFEPSKNRYSLKALNTQINQDSIESVYRQKPDGKQIFMDAMKPHIVNDLIELCAQRGSCKE
ncbi:hypothetical protein [Helicobacter suis]|uniref:hypothetical protein n=1 Tax=Helicobacter suis TaxID=104628 RepID=UPI0013D82D51|nr:hypothetical protein [Helicobacter suis]